MAKKTDNFYFNNFIESAGLSCEAAEMLKAVLVNFDVKKLPEQRAQLHEPPRRSGRRGPDY